MAKAKIIFSNNEELEVTSEDRIIPVNLITDIEEKSTSMGLSMELYDHVHDGLIPAITTALSLSEFFYLNSNDDTIYKSSAVVKIVNI